MRTWLVWSVVVFTACRITGPVLLPADDACTNACKVLEHYGCEEARPRKDRTCADRCRQLEETGYVTVHPDCVVQHSDSLEDVRALCRYSCKEGKP